jgi:hypothetical protein
MREKHMVWATSECRQAFLSHRFIFFSPMCSLPTNKNICTTTILLFFRFSLEVIKKKKVISLVCLGVVVLRLSSHQMPPYMYSNVIWDTDVVSFFCSLCTSSSGLIVFVLTVFFFSEKSVCECHVFLLNISDHSITQFLHHNFFSVAAYDVLPVSH